jgi:creatinine amidohydrolase
MALTYFASTAAPELRDAIAGGAIGLWPLGATEQHGAHLVTGFDLASATAVCERAAREAASTVILLPGMPIGASEHWLDLGATLSMKPATLLAVIGDVIRSIDRCGFERLLIVNGHFGNMGVMNAAIGDLNDVKVDVEVMSYWMLVDAGRLAAACETDAGGLGHAGEVETSIALALGSELVVAERLPAPPGRPLHKGEPGGPAGSLVRLPRPLRDAPEGVYGDPSRARRELGEFVLAEAATALARHIDRRTD